MQQQRHSRHALAFILVTVVIDTVGFGIVIPVTPALIMQLTGEKLSGAAQYGGGLMFVYAALQFVCSPILGNLSDRFGRRPVLIGSLAALGLDYVLMGLAPSITWLFVGRALAGVFGATFPTASAYVADITSAQERAKSFGLVGAAWGFGFIIGPVIGGLLVELGPRVPFFAAAGLALANVVYGWFVLSETLARDQRRSFELARANPFGAFRQLRHYPLVIGLFAAVFLYQIAHDSMPSVWTFFTMERFGWSETEVGLSLGFVGILTAIVQGGLVGAIVKRVGEERTVYLGYTLQTVGFLGYAFALSSGMFYAFVPISNLGSVANPAMRSLLSQQVPPNAQGELQGALMSLMSLTAVGSPVLMTQLFARFTGAGAPVYFPGAPFLLAAILALGALLVSFLVLRSHRASKPAAQKGTSLS